MAYNLHSDNLIYTLYHTFSRFSSVSDLQDKTALEIGAGVGLKSIPLAKLFLNYVVLEPDILLFNKLQSNCIKFDSKIESYNVKVLEYKTRNKYDVVILNNVFHLILNEMVYDHLLSLLKPGGIIYVQQPLPHPRGWGDDRLNEGSKSFDSKLWLKMSDKLFSARDFMLSNGFQLVQTDRYGVYIKQDKEIL